MNSQNSDIKCCALELKPLRPVRQQQQQQQQDCQTMPTKHKTTGGGSKSIFPQKLWHLVNNSQLDSAIRWTLDGRSFLVFENQFRNLCLGKENKFFYTTQAKSFVRQLHLYGFRKVNKNQFLHPNFKRDHPELLSNIRRTYKQSCLTSTQGIKHDTINQDELLLQQQQQQQQVNDKWFGGGCGDRSNQTLVESRTEVVKANVSTEHRYSSCRSESQSNQQFRHTLTELVAADDGNAFATTNTEVLSLNSTSSIGALVFPSNNYGEDEVAYTPNPMAWYDANYADINYSYNEGLSLYNSDVYPSSSCEDNNNITL